MRFQWERERERERESETLLFRDFNIIITHVFPEKFHWSLSEDMKIFSFNVNYFYWIFEFFDISLLQRN